MTLLRNVWKGGSTKGAFRSWYTNKGTNLNITWGIWLTKKFKLFEEQGTLPLKCVIQSLNILNAYPHVEEKQKRWNKRRSHK
jgi:hypothetical protein